MESVPEKYRDLYRVPGVFEAPTTGEVEVVEIPQPETCDTDVIPGAPPGKDGNWEFIPEVSDEFDGTKLDTSKWQPDNPGWKGREPGWFNPDNVLVENSCLKLKSKVQDPPAGYPPQYHTFSTAFVRSVAQVKYGYFEVLVRPADSITSSAFWFVCNNSETWNEIDVFELSTAQGFEKMFNTNAHVFRENGENFNETKSFPKKIPINFRVDEKFTVALEWDEDKIEWSINGKVVRTLENKHWHVPMWVQFDSETMGDWFGLPEPDDPRLPATYKVFRIRTWRKVN